MKYNAPFGSTDPDAPYKDRNMSIGEQGSIPPAVAIEGPQREIEAVIRAFLPDVEPSNEDMTQLLQALQAALGQGSSGAGASGFNKRLVFGPGTTVWVPPGGVNLCHVNIWGGGGGGGGSNGPGAAGAGGGGGGYYSGYLPIVPLIGIPITVGAGGIGGGPGGTGQNGGTSLFGALAGAYGGTGGGGSISGVGKPVGKAGKGFGIDDDEGNAMNFQQYGGFGGTGSLTGSNLFRGGSGGYAFGSGQSPEPVGAVGTGQPVPFDPGSLIPNIGQGGAGASNNGFGLSGQYGLIVVDYREPE